MIGGAAIVIGAPHGIRPQRKGGEKAQRKATSSAQVGFRRYVDAPVTRHGFDEFAHRIFRAIIHHDYPLHGVGLVDHLCKRSPQ